MATLTIDFFLRDPQLSLKGLSFKAIAGSDLNSRLYRTEETGKYAIDTRFNINGRTAHIEESFLIKMLVELMECVPFDKIKTKNYYHLTGDQILEKIKEHQNSHA